MLFSRIRTRFLTRLGAPAEAAERHRIERGLASARVFLAGTALLAIWLDPTEPSRYATLAYVLLISYVVYSVVIWLLLDRFEGLTPSLIWIHGFDVAFPAFFTLFTAGPNSPFFLFFVFVLTAAAVRWGFVETVATSATIFLLIVSEAWLLSYGPQRLGSWLQGEYELNRFVIRASYLLMIGVLLGLLAEEQKLLQAESAVITRVIGKARLDAGLRGTMQAVLGEVLEIFSARRALAVLRQTGSERIFLWHSEAFADGGNSIAASEAPPERRGDLFTAWPVPVHSFFAEQRGPWRCWSIDSGGNRVRTDAFCDVIKLPELNEARSVLCVGFLLGDEWSGHLLLFDADLGWQKLKEVRFAQKLLRQIGPAVYTIYLLRRLRSRAGAIERARVARELHDGALQAIIGVEMEIDVLRRQLTKAGATAPPPGALERVQQLLRDQVFALRTLMQELKPVELTPGQLLDYMADHVNRFRRDSGIAAQFVCGLDEVDLPPRTCRELVRILQEALVNIRKHSGARNVLVRFASDQGKWVLVVEDDGRGFDFTGQRDLPDLDAAHLGPAIIKERVRMLGGNLSIDSQPGRGAHLQITLPQKRQVAYV